jgi:hypothetical protein
VQIASVNEIPHQVENLRVHDVFGLEELSGGGCAGQNENTGADDGADTERGERPRAERLSQAMLGVLRVGDKFVDGLAREKLTGQLDAPA